MRPPLFDPLNPPTARNPLPAYGSAPSMRLLQDLMRAGHHQRPPVLGPKSMALLIEIEAALATGLVPASAGEMRDAMVALLSHYPARRMSSAERVSVARDWLVDLSGIPADIIAAACQEWRRGTNLYAPTPGQLLGIAQPVLAARRFYHQNAADRLKAQPVAAEKA